jgi:hypothetical protein
MSFITFFVFFRDSTFAPRMNRFRLFTLFLTTSLLLLFQPDAPAQQSRVRRQVKLPVQLQEVSGMTFRPDGSLWMLNDSQNPAELYRVNMTSGLVEETVPLPTANRDWEDLTCDGNGKLFIGDFGNNQNKRRNLRILIFDPVSGSLDSIMFSYPDQVAFPPADIREQNFDMEAFVFFRDSLHLFSKHRFRGDFVCKHYILPSTPGSFTARLVESRVIPDCVITGAALDSNTSTLALTGYIVGFRWGVIPRTRASAMFFSSFEDSRFLGGDMSVKKLPKFLVARQFESITHVRDNIWLVANEGRKWQKQRLWRLKYPACLPKN